MLYPLPFILKKRQNCYYLPVCSFRKNTQEHEINKKPTRSECILEKEMWDNRYPYIVLTFNINIFFFVFVEKTKEKEKWYIQFTNVNIFKVKLS